MKPRTHFRITEQAVTAFLATNAGRTPAGLEIGAHRHPLANGAKWEDLPSKLRRKHWHFFAANASLRQEIHHGVLPASFQIVAIRQEQLFEALGHDVPDRLFICLGRILHHIQDMSTPSHVVPVYHGPYLKTDNAITGTGRIYPEGGIAQGLTIEDPFETFLSDKWQHILSLAPIRPTPEDGDGDAAADFVVLYTQAAQATAHLLEGSTLPLLIDGQRFQADTSLYWLAHEQVRSGQPAYFANGFGGFGILGRHFGEIGSISVDGHQYLQIPSECMNFARLFVHKAIVDSMHALQLFCTLLTRAGLAGRVP